MMDAFFSEMKAKKYPLEKEFKKLPDLNEIFRIIY